MGSASNGPQVGIHLAQAGVDMASGMSHISISIDTDESIYLHSARGHEGSPCVSALVNDDWCHTSTSFSDGTEQRALLFF